MEVGSSNLPGTTYGGLAQLARAPALHAGGQRFESVILHKDQKGQAIFDIMKAKEQKNEQEQSISHTPIRTI